MNAKELTIQAVKSYHKQFSVAELQEKTIPQLLCYAHPSDRSFLETIADNEKETEQVAPVSKTLKTIRVRRS